MATSVFINEIHYDNAGGDTGEAVEIAAPAGTDLTGWTLVFYNGGNPGAAVTYRTTALSGIIDNEGNGYGALSFGLPVDGIQNGANDGVALVRPDGTVVQLLSYEGVFTASNGPAAGMVSTDIGVAEGSATPAGFSLQLKGTGTTYSDFSWAAESASSFGSGNAGQSFGSAPAPVTLSIADVSVNEGNSGTTSLTFTVSLSAPAPAGGVTFDIATADGSAVAGSDYVAKALTGQTIPAGQTSYSFTVDVSGDTAFEASEALVVNVTNVVGATVTDGQATGTIVNDDVAPPAPVANVYINEIHYDNAGTDTGEAIEIAGVAGTDLSGYQLVLYNGSNTPGAAPTYGVVNLSGVIDDEGQGYGALAFTFPANGLQNGLSDGVALIAPDGSVIQLLSYEGTSPRRRGPPPPGSPAPTSRYSKGAAIRSASRSSSAATAPRRPISSGRPRRRAASARSTVASRSSPTMPPGWSASAMRA